MQKHMYLSKDKHLCEKLVHLAHYFPVRILLVFESNTSFLSKGKHECQKVQHLAYGFPVRIDLCFERKIFLKLR
jgi:hypothetical protein